MVKENLGVVYTICQGAILTFFLHLGIVAFLIATRFEMSLPWFTAVLGLAAFFVSAYIGYKSHYLWMVTGSLVGLISIGMILAYLSQYLDMKLEMNLVLVAIYVTIGFAGSAFGRWFSRKKKAE